MSRSLQSKLINFQLIIILAIFFLILLVVLQNMRPSEPNQQPACVLNVNENYTFHRVERGETLQSIADDYNITPELLAEINTACIDNPNRLVEDLIIRVPAPFAPATEAPILPPSSPTPLIEPNLVPTSTPIRLEQVVIAIQDIPAGMQITEDMVTAVDFPSEFLSSGSIETIEDVIGKYTRTEIVREQFILRRHLIDDPEDTGHSYEIVCIATRDIAAGEMISAERVYYLQSLIVAAEVDNNPLYQGRCFSFDGMATRDIPQFTPIRESDIGD